MGRSCTVCTHSSRAAIDAALVAGAAYRDVAGQHGLSKTAVARHRRDHLPAALAHAREAADVAHGDDLLHKVADLETTAKRLGSEAEAAGDRRSALAAVRELVRIVELLGELRGEVDRRPTVNVLTTSVEWLATRAAIMQALRPYPEARHAVVAALASGVTP